VQGWHRYWGKAYGEDDIHLLAFHSLDVAAVGMTLLIARPEWRAALARVAEAEESGLAEAVTFHLALHDLGKFGNGFQGLKEDVVRRLGRSPTVRANRPRHDTLGDLLWRKLTSPEHDCPDLALDIRGADGTSLTPRRTACRWRPWIAAVTGHHGRPPEVVMTDLLESHFGLESPSGPWKDAADFVGRVRALLRPAGIVLRRDAEEVEEDHLARSSWWLAGFTTLCDWVGSNREWFGLEQQPLDLEVYWERALEQAEHAVSAAGLSPRKPRSFRGFPDLFPHIPEPSPLQRGAAEVPLQPGPQLFLIEDITGSGKTEAALTLVGRLFDAGLADGLYFALPTMATANAMHARVAAVLGRLFESDPPPSLVLAHSGPRLRPRREEGEVQPPDDGGYDRGESSASQVARSWFTDNRKKALLADAGVGTIDQALTGVLRSKHAPLRLLGLHRHVLVVDEVHACDDYMNEILELLLEVQAAHGGSAVLLSATLPLAARRRLISAFRRGLGSAADHELGDAYPVLVQAGEGETTEIGLPAGGASARRLPVAFFHSFDEVVAWCEERANDGRCVAWIRNTVADAMAAFDALVARVGAERVRLFHARFPMGDRLEIEGEIVERFGKGGSPQGRAGQIVVATQVLEQSLDVDFDEMVTDLAPIDRIIQRAGRLQRHHRPERPPAPLHVLAPPWEEAPTATWLGKDFAGTLAVYQRPSYLWLTQRVLREEGALDLPLRARFLVESVFGETVEKPASFDEQRKELEADGTVYQRRSMAHFNRISFERGYTREGPEWRDDELVPTRLGEPTVILRLVRSLGGELTPWMKIDGVDPSVCWRMGELSVRASQVAGGGVETEDLRKKLAAIEAEPPLHVIPVLMTKSGDSWGGTLEASKAAIGAPARVEVLVTPGRGVELKAARRS